MKKEIIIPIKCSTVKKVKGIIPHLIFWVIVVGCITLFGLLIYAATLPGSNVFEIIIGGIVFAAVCILFLWLSCPYDFKCIQEEK
jgi:hypothetical protein